MTENERLKALGATIGSKLIGSEVNKHGEKSTDIIQITAIGEKIFLAKRIEKNGKAQICPETTWTLSMREWKLLQ